MNVGDLRNYLIRALPTVEWGLRIASQYSSDNWRLRTVAIGLQEARSIAAKDQHPMKRIFFLLVVLGVQNAYANDVGLRLYEVSDPGRIWRVNTSVPSVVDAVPQGIRGAIPAFEYGLGSFYAASTNRGNTDLFVLEPNSGTLLDTIVMSFPANGNAITSLEFVGATLYGGLTTEGGGPSALVTINLSNGMVNSVGDMGLDSPTGGLAYDGVTMYTVNSGKSGFAKLYEVSLVTGLATEVADIIDEQDMPIALTGLEFGTDGVLYGLGRTVNGLGNSDDETLFSIETVTGAAQRIGFMAGLEEASSLTMFPVPEPTSSATVLMASLAASTWRMRRLS